uniref:Uncharacterized protein n=1 Tax=Euplotes harpa TaxID=151035 RepID=A0A7S3JP33_9SPIT|mmetsp:Transcript_8035/g.9111  ORF Transcript_8035/g.9111 Transcript_8035/m.9111 type:complete len:120 (+) Transcript_8035:304-663(+)
MCVLQTNFDEFRLQATLVALERGLYPSKIATLDRDLEDTLNNLLFSRYLKLSEERAVQTRLKLVANRDQVQGEEDRGVLELMRYLNEASKLTKEAVKRSAEAKRIVNWVKKMKAGREGD